ncbi:MAG TPA: zinc ribbon domain-containing protein [Gemmatimonadales bacterium]|nr:zinc ribbon domain-containing protein [Gemmatimonadales bacterium]
MREVGTGNAFRVRALPVDELDLLFAKLVEVLSRDVRLATPFPAADVYERLVPYRSNRSRLRVATHQDYEMTVLRLLAGERGYVRLEPDEIREGFQREVTQTNPDPAIFRNFPDSQVMINRLAAERFLRGESVYAPPAPAGDDLTDDPVVEEEPIDYTSENPIPVVAGAAFEIERDTRPGAQCAYCGGVLPGDRKVNFCPHCGQPPSGELRCPACGSEVDVGWAYCVGCGRGTGFE